MGYLHINNLYKDQLILQMKEVYALEKIHGTSAHIKFVPVYSNDEMNDETCEIHFFSGGEKYEKFVNLFDAEKLKEIYNERYLGSKLTIYGEAYGGKIQGMSKTYGPDLKFVAFEVRIGESWLDVPNALDVVTHFDLEFVDFVKIPTTLEAIDAERDKDSVQAVRNGMGEGHMREGVVLRPLIEVRLNNGSRVVAKHKRDEFRETSKPRKVVDPAQLEVLQEAEAIANEWVTAERMRHVLQKLPEDTDITKTGLVVRAMQEDVVREAEGEIVVSKQALAAIGKKAATMFRALVTKVDMV